MDFFIDWDTVVAEVGLPGIEKLKNLRDWLRDRPLATERASPPKEWGVVRLLPPAGAAPDNVRVAPSIITRSEAELFGVSAPRFAFRVYLNDPKIDASFVNVRRLSRLQDAIRSANAGDHDPLANIERLHEDLGRIAKEGICVADSYLTLPKRLANDYIPLTQSLTRAYGELDADEQNLGTPFIQHLNLACGLCAQAAWYMALVMMEQYAKGIYGIAEITAIAQGGTSIDFEDVTVHQSSTFFGDSKIGLRGGLQAVFKSGMVAVSEAFVEAMGVLPDDDPLRARRRAYSAWAIRSYLASGMPVILPVDLECMWAPNGIALANRLDVYFMSRPEICERGHAVVAVGYHKTNRAKFLVNDPASYPFLEASIQQLDDADLDFARGKYLTFVPVTPGAVVVPLYGDGQSERGVVFGAQGLQTLRVFDLFAHYFPRLQNEHPPQFAVDEWQPGEWRLVNRSSFCYAQTFDSVCGDEELRRLLENDLETDRWYWMQYLDAPHVPPTRSVWIWEAERPIQNTLASVAAALRQVLVSNAPGLWRPLFAPLAPAVPPPMPNPYVRKHERRTLKSSLISSFSTTGLDDSSTVFARLRQRQQPAQHIPAEVYIFMEKDVETFLQCRRGTRAVGFLADLRRNNGDAVEALARRIADRFAHVIGFASFISEVASGETAIWNLAKDALATLIDLAVCLQDMGREARFIEIVAGSRLDRLTKLGNGHLGAQLRDDDLARLRVVDLLDEVLGKHPHADRVFWSIELEPGYYFAVNGWDSLVKLAADLEARPHLAGRVGFNLDVSHFKLAHIDPDRIRKFAPIRHRIIHAHASGHHRCGHFGDVAPLSLNEPIDFEPWLDLLQDIDDDVRQNRRTPGCPNYFSGHLSLELEAVRGLDFVHAGLEQLKELIL